MVSEVRSVSKSGLSLHGLGVICGLTAGAWLGTAEAPTKLVNAGYIDEWDDFLTGRYQEGKSENEFRQYDETATPGVAEFKNYMPEESLYMLRYHSFYAAHRHGAYRHLISNHDLEMLEWVNKFNVYDLYSKGHTKPDLKTLKPYYDDLFAEFFPEKIAW